MPMGRGLTTPQRAFGGKGPLGLDGMRGCRGGGEPPEKFPLCFPRFFFAFPSSHLRYHKRSRASGTEMPRKDKPKRAPGPTQGHRRGAAPAEPAQDHHNHRATPHNKKDDHLKDDNGDGVELKDVNAEEQQLNEEGGGEEQ